jgi:D-amino peptidase
MEGVADITSVVQCRRDTSEFARSCELMTQETIAACAGASSAGATEIIVNDSHGDMRNIEHEHLPPAVRLIRGSNKPLSMVQGADAGIDAALFIGYHAAANSLHGILDHTYWGAQAHEVLLNGETCSEGRLNAAVLGHWGVPVIFLSGDQTACADARRFLPWIETAAVKESLGRAAAISLSPAVAREMIREGTAHALQSLGAGKMQAYRPVPPLTVRIRLMNPEKADVTGVMPGVTRVDGTTVEYVADDILTLFRAATTMMRLASTA